MTPEWLNRTLLLIGEKQLTHLQQVRILIVGLGGVGAYAAEMLIRAGVSHMTLVDGDIIESSNRNRQLHALIKNEGKLKTTVLKERFLEINPEADIQIISKFIEEQQIIEIFNSNNYHYIIDAIDSLSSKIYLITEAIKQNIPLVSAMGAGDKLNPSAIEVSDIAKTHQCPLAAAVRRNLRKKGIHTGFKAVYSTEKINKFSNSTFLSKDNKKNIGTISYMPAIFGCWCAAVCINDILNNIASKNI